MNRRAFLTFATAATTIVRAEGTEDAERSTWWESVENVNTFSTATEDGVLHLEIALITPKNVEERPRKHEADGVDFIYEGAVLEEGFWPGRTLLRKFTLSWGGTRIPIPERFWKNLPGFRIEQSRIDPTSLTEAEQRRFTEFLERLMRPRVILSADGGTALIEWMRSEECDSRSTIRWMVSRNGTVLRHRHTPPCEC